VKLNEILKFVSEICRSFSSEFRCFLL